MFQTKVVKEIKMRICVQLLFFFSKILPLWDNVGKYWRAGLATGDNMAHVHRIAKATQTFTICNIYSFSTATVVARTCQSVTV